METMFASLTSSGITVSSFLICSLVALLCGALIAFTYTRRTRFTQSLVLAVILLPFADRVLSGVDGFGLVHISDMAARTQALIE